MNLRSQHLAIYYLTITLFVLEIAIVVVTHSLANGFIGTLLWFALVANTLPGVLLVKTRFVIA